MIMVDPADNRELIRDAEGDSQAQAKIENLFQQLIAGSDFTNTARSESEDPTSLRNGGDIGFATEKDLVDNGFPQTLIRLFFGEMQIGAISRPVRFETGKWYIFKLLSRNLTIENLTLESPGVRKQISDDLMKQHTEVVRAELLETAMNNAKVVNYLASATN